MARSLEEIVRGTYQAGAVAQNGIFNNASQHWNHNLFWEVMGPGEDKKMPARWSRAGRAFGSVQKFKDDFAAAGAGQFGSGWCWLVKDTDGSLKVTKTENGVNPLCFGQTALLGCDVWEHSYYIDFRNKRPAYLTNFLGRDKLVNWEAVRVHRRSGRVPWLRSLPWCWSGGPEGFPTPCMPLSRPAPCWTRPIPCIVFGPVPRPGCLGRPWPCR
jgi:superoxide dismutase, Fe-Mn family